MNFVFPNGVAGREPGGGGGEGGKGGDYPYLLQAVTY
jgi:hypothetical protein